MAKYKGETMIVDEFIQHPIPENTKIFFSHFGRYYYASKVLNIKSSDTIIDASCGAGYGTFPISQLAKHTYGLDINEEYIHLAKNNYHNNNLTFITYENFYKIYPGLQVDKILCIETLEHIPKDEINDFTERLLSKLKSGGSMFVTVPLGNNEPSTYNQWHCNEPSIDFIHDMFSKYFKTINMEIDSFVNSFGYECQYCFLILKTKYNNIIFDE